MVDDKSTENEDVCINFLHRKTADIYIFPEKADNCWVPYENIKTVMSEPSIQPKRNIEYTFRKDELIKAYSCITK